jgi:hypothetical protein
VLQSNTRLAACRLKKGKNCNQRQGQTVAANREGWNWGTSKGPIRYVGAVESAKYYGACVYEILCLGKILWNASDINALVKILSASF